MGLVKFLKDRNSGDDFEAELLEDMDISSIFYISDIYKYFESNEETFDKSNYPMKNTEGRDRIWMPQLERVPK